MAIKKATENKETTKDLFMFPDPIIDGVQGITIEAENIEEATEKLKKLLTNAEKN
jgi:hypothetical protein